MIVVSPDAGSKRITFPSALTAAKPGFGKSPSRNSEIRAPESVR